MTDDNKKRGPGRPTEKRKDTILVRALPISSRELGVSGECDLVEFHKCEDSIPVEGLWVFDNL